MPDILTTKDAGEILEIEPVAVIRAINRGRIEAKKFGIQWMITREEVMKYKKNRRVTKRTYSVSK